MGSQELKWNAKLYQDNSSFQFNLALMAIEKLKPKGYMRKLDIGCGNGDTTIELAKHVPDGEIVAIEISADMCEQALINIKEKKVANISVINKDAFDINFNNEFDAVFANSSIHWIYDLETMYSKIYRALKNKGRIIIQTATKDNNILIDAAYRLLEISELREYFKNLKLPWRFLTIDENIKILENNNYKNISAEPYLYEYIFDNLKRIKDFFKSAALIPFLSVLPEEKYAQLTNEFLELYFKLNMSDNLKVKMNRVFISAEKLRGIGE
jgi:FkbM family methyltransferase